MNNFSSPPLKGAAPQTKNRDFGVLKVKGLKLGQSQAKVISDLTDLSRFERMTNAQLIDVVYNGDLSRKRSLSRWFYERNGMYTRAVRYIADLFRFDFMVYPNIVMTEELKDERQKKILKKWDEVLEFFDNSTIQLLSRKWAIKVCLDGCYYGYICDDISDKLVIQDLPVDYCRSRFTHKGLPLVEFNVKYFDAVGRNEETKKMLLSLFPEEIQKGYRKYKNTKDEENSWIFLDTGKAFKFYFSEGDIPPFITAIPSLLELQEVRDLEKEKLLQEISKILIQKFELDKNNQLPFTMTELQRLNQNAIDMVGDAVGVSVLSTIADVHLENLTPSTVQGADAVESAEKNVYNNLGISTNLFNTDGNLALDKSIIIDEAFAKPMLLEFEAFFNRLLDSQYNKKDLKFRLKMLTTSIFNYEDLSKDYENLTKLGFSRFLPMVAMGHTQKEVISLAKLEQQALQLDMYMLPPFSSNTMSSDTWSSIKEQQKGAVSNEGGRPELPDDKKSDKTLANEASK